MPNFLRYLPVQAGTDLHEIVNGIEMNLYAVFVCEPGCNSGEGHRGTTTTQLKDFLLVRYQARLPRTAMTSGFHATIRFLSCWNEGNKQLVNLYRFMAVFGSFRTILALL